MEVLECMNHVQSIYWLQPNEGNHSYSTTMEALSYIKLLSLFFT